MARKRPRTSVDESGTGKRVSRLAGFGGGTDQRKGADWGEADPVLLAGLVVCVTRLGGLCSFGYTSDGGACTVTVFLDGERATTYIKPAEDIDQVLAAAVDYFHNLS